MYCLDGEGVVFIWGMFLFSILKKELGCNGGFMYYFFFFFMGYRKVSGVDIVGDDDEVFWKRKSKNLVKDMKNKLGIFRWWNEFFGVFFVGKVDKMMKLFKFILEEVFKWGEFLEKLLVYKYGLVVF